MKCDMANPAVLEMEMGDKLVAEQSRMRRIVRRWTMPDDLYTERDNKPINRGGFELNRVLVVMPFAEELEDEYQSICDQCERLGLHPHRIDANAASDNLLREMTKDIERAEFIIYDLSHESANVYYQLGYAHGVGNEAFDILLISKEGVRPHFDIRPLRVHYYQDLTELQHIISLNLKQMIQMTR